MFADYLSIFLFLTNNNIVDHSENDILIQTEYSIVSGNYKDITPFYTKKGWRPQPDSTLYPEDSFSRDNAIAVSANRVFFKKDYPKLKWYKYINPQLDFLTIIQSQYKLPKYMHNVLNFFINLSCDFSLKRVYKYRPSVYSLEYIKQLITGNFKLRKIEATDGKKLVFLKYLIMYNDLPLNQVIDKFNNRLAKLNSRFKTLNELYKHWYKDELHPINVSMRYR
jgi:hypothetical protein